jgi:drug/metabolite transporter (DMT)-like permease
VAIDRASIGVASTIMSLTPLFLIPVSRFVFREPITLRAVVGTLIALAGVALLLQ